MRRVAVIGLCGVAAIGAAWWYTHRPDANEGKTFTCGAEFSDVQFTCGMPSIPDIPSLITIRGEDGGVSALGTQFGMIEGRPFLKLRCEGGVERVVDPGDAEREVFVDHFADGEIRSVGLMKAGKKDGLWVRWSDHSTVDVLASGLYWDDERIGSLDPQVIPALTRHR